MAEETPDMFAATEEWCIAPDAGLDADAALLRGIDWPCTVEPREELRLLREYKKQRKGELEREAAGVAAAEAERLAAVAAQRQMKQQKWTDADEQASIKRAEEQPAAWMKADAEIKRRWKREDEDWARQRHRDDPCSRRERKLKNLGNW